MRRLIATGSWPNPPSGTAAEMQWYAVIDTLTHCKAEDEWLSAAQESTTKANANNYSAAVLQTYCATRSNFGIDFNPSDAPSCVVRSTPLEAKLGLCPPTLPLVSPQTLNPGRAGLDGRLVPIDAVRVRICRYDLNGHTVRGTLEGVGELSGPVAARIEDETNALHRVQPAGLAASPTGMSCPGPFFVTFAGDTEQVNVAATECDAVTNGVFLAFGSSTWLNDVNRYTGDLPVVPESSLILKGPTGPTG